MTSTWSCIEQFEPAPDFRGVPLMKIFKNSKIVVKPWLSGPVFSGCGPKPKLRLQHFFALSREEIDLTQNQLFRVQATCPKSTCEKIIGPWKFCADSSNKSKVMALFCGDRWTHRHMEICTHGWTHKTQTDSKPQGRQFFCKCVRGKVGHFEACKISTSSLCEI